MFTTTHQQQVSKAILNGDIETVIQLESRNYSPTKTSLKKEKTGSPDSFEDFMKNIDHPSKLFTDN